MTNITLQHLEKALSTLKSGFSLNPNELERDGIIQRFEYCVELSWKTSKKILSAQGIDTDVPKNVFRELAILGKIQNPEEWIEFINARNKASHIYNENVAKEVFAVIPRFITSCQALLLELENMNK